MKQYTAWMSQTDTYKVYFKANNLEHAKELLGKVNEGDISFEELPEHFDKLKSVEVEFALDTLVGEDDNK